METGHLSTRAVNSGSGNRALAVTPTVCGAWVVRSIIIDVRIIRAHALRLTSDIQCVLAKSRRGRLRIVTPVKRMFTVSLISSIELLSLNDMHGLADRKLV